MQELEILNLKISSTLCRGSVQALFNSVYHLTNARLTFFHMITKLILKHKI